MQIDGVPELITKALQQADGPLSIVELREALVRDGLLSPSDAKTLFDPSLARALDSHPQITFALEEVATGKGGHKEPRRRTTTSTRTVKKYRWVDSNELSATESLPSEEVNIEPSGQSQTDLSEGRSLESLIAEVIAARRPVTARDLDEMAAALRGSSERDIKSAIATLERERGTDSVLLFLAAPGNSRAVRKAIVKWAGKGGDESALAQVLAWLMAARVPAGQMDNTASYLSDARREWGLPVAEVCVAQLTQSVVSYRSAALSLIANTRYVSLIEAMKDSDLARIRTAIRSEPMGLARGKVLWAMMQIDPNSIEDAGAWSRASLDDLTELAKRPRERALLDLDWVRTHVVAELVAEDLRGADRFSVARALSYPSPIFRVVSPKQLEEALQSASRNDEALRAALSNLRQVAVVRRLTEDVGSLNDELDSARQREALLQVEVQQKQEALEHWQAKARRAEEEVVSAGTHEIRQAHLEGMKALVEALGLVDRLGSDATPESTFQRLLAVAARHGVSPIGAKGELVEYDPALHQALTPMDIGQPAVVHECGFTLREANGDTVLARATVSSQIDD